MPVYLPIAEMSVDALSVILLGAVTGLLSGMLGVGGGFIMTPMLIFLGIPPSIAVASSANQIIASSVSGFFAHLRRQNVDFEIGTLLLAGGIAGSGLGVWLFDALSKIGQIDLVISVCYVVFLGGIGGLMVVESLKAILQSRKPERPLFHKRRRMAKWMRPLPLRLRFKRSGLYMSVLVPITIGFVVGVMVSMMGVGGGFITIPAMIYLLRMPTSVVIGTSLYQIIFLTANVTFLHAITTHTVDIVLAFLLLIGAVFGAQLGMRISNRMPTEYLRGILALLVLGMSMQLLASLLMQPDDLYTISLESYKK